MLFSNFILLSTFNFFYFLETFTIPTNAVFYIVAVIALLSRISSLVQNLNKSPNVGKTAFSAYKLVFGTILLECLCLVICLDGYKAQMGVLAWIIYMSALMVLFMIFLTLTIDDAANRPEKLTIKENTNTLSGSSADFAVKSSAENVSTTVINLFLAIFALYIGFDLVHLLSNHYDTVDIIFSESVSASNITLGTREEVNNLFTKVAIDIANSLGEYILSGLVQAVCLISIILLIVFR